MKVIVCGSRDWDDIWFLWDVLGQQEPKISFLIQGGAKGADEHARSWAKAHEVPQQEYEADWNKHGKAAGPIRNQKMLDEGKPDVVIAFPGGRGTADMVRRAKAAGVEVIEVTYADDPP